MTLTLPSGPSIGDEVGIADGEGGFNSNNLTVGRNGSNIMSVAEDMTVNIQYAAFSLIYQDATNGWRIK